MPENVKPNRCVIICASPEFHLAGLRADDYIIACDGGYEHAVRSGVRPHLVLGDFDSYAGEVAGDIPPLRAPCEKDDTDTMLAVRRGLELGFRRFVIYGGLEGRRLDHTVANFQALGFLAQQGAVGFLVGKESICCAVKNAGMQFPREAEGDFSLFCLGPDAKGVTIRNLYYEAENITLTSFFPLGVSNHFTGKQASFTVADGTVLATWQRKSGFPQIV